MEEQFGNRLIKLRREKGFSQEELGDYVGVSRQTVSKWELNLTTPELEKLILLGKVFAITIDELVGNESVSSEKLVYEELNRKIDNLSSRKYHYEYRSKKMVGRRPLVHINIGLGLYKANGIISIGMLSTGIISAGILSCGVISIGFFALGIIAMASFAAGLIAAGSIAVGFLASGAIAIGYYSVGAVAIGVYSLGADAIALRVASGDVATGYIAIGKTSVNGTIEIFSNKATSEEIKQAILKKYPDIWKVILHIFSSQGL